MDMKTSYLTLILILLQVDLKCEILFNLKVVTVKLSDEMEYCCGVVVFRLENTAVTMKMKSMSLFCNIFSLQQPHPKWSIKKMLIV